MPVHPLNNAMPLGGKSNLSLPQDVAQAGGLKVARATYDFSVDGGAVSAISLLPAGQLLPSGAIIVSAFLNVRTIPTSGGSATVALGTGESATDLLAATAYNASPFSTTGWKALAPVWTAASAITLTANRRLTATIAAAALTAGVFDVVVCYFVLA